MPNKERGNLSWSLISNGHPLNGGSRLAEKSSHSPKRGTGATGRRQGRLPHGGLQRNPKSSCSGLKALAKRRVSLGVPTAEVMSFPSFLVGSHSWKSQDGGVLELGLTPVGS